MPSSDKAEELRARWNKVSADYQANQTIPTHSPHYGPWSPLESELNLLGDIAGQRILELGCGGGQSSIAFARQGATVTGLDLSDAQLVFARQLAAQEQVSVRFVQGDAADLTPFAAGAWDIVFSVYTFGYVVDMPACLAGCSRLLRSRGRLVFSLDHPLRDCFVDSESDDLSIFPTRSYFDNTSLRWRWRDSSVYMATGHYTIGQWCTLLTEAGLQLLRIVEPPPPTAMLDALWPEDDALAPLRLIPQTIIFVAEKR